MVINFLIYYVNIFSKTNLQVLNMFYGVTKH
jgi:hypothetical protein